MFYFHNMGLLGKKISKGFIHRRSQGEGQRGHAPPKILSQITKQYQKNQNIKFFAPLQVY